jgi:hypothetical protein
MKKLSKNAIIGYPAGIITGITYGLNPLFAMPLINKGAAIESILFSATPSQWYCWDCSFWLQNKVSKYHSNRQEYC